MSNKEETQNTFMQDYNKSLLKAISEFPEIKKDETANIKYKDKNGKWQDKSYKYASLSSILRTVVPILNQNSIRIKDKTINGNIQKTFLVHANGYSEDTEHLLYQSIPTNYNKGIDHQGIASSKTYARRYNIMDLLGICPSDDDDGYLGSLSVGSDINDDKVIDYTSPFKNDEERTHFTKCFKTLLDGLSDAKDLEPTRVKYWKDGAKIISVIEKSPETHPDFYECLQVMRNNYGLCKKNLTGDK